MTPEFIREMITIVESGTPLYVQVADSLRNRIVAGDLPSGTRLPSEAELAASLGINHLTLRKSLRILAEQKLISQRQGRGTFVAYSPRAQLRLGLVSSKLSGQGTDLYTLRMISALNQQLNQNQGGEIIILDCEGLDADEILDKINQNRCDGVIEISTSAAITTILCSKAFDFIPMVFVNSSSRTVSEAQRFEVRLGPGSITAGVNYLTGLGHRRIAYISAAVTNNPTLMQRNAEFMACDLPEAMPLIARDGAYWYDSARQSLYDACRSKKPPTAVICPGITFSYGAWLGAAEAGLRIPDDLSFIGFDADISTNPHMTSLEQPIDQIAGKAVGLLSDMWMAGKHLKQRVYEFEAQLCERGSCQKKGEETC